MSALDLLPADEESPKCADFTAGLGVDPAGNAIRADLLIAAETPPPWPKPVFAHDLLANVPDAVAAAPVPTRVLAAMPTDPERLSIVAYRRSRRAGEPSVRREWRTDADGLTAAVQAVVAGGEPEAEEIHGVPVPELWICTQGSHDICCGSYGARLADQATADLGDRALVRRVSHTGGHRFAPTAVHLPSGRMYAYLTMADLEAIVSESSPPAADLVLRTRGWWGAEAGPGQVAERVGFGMFGWEWNRAMREVAVVDSDNGHSTVEVRAILPSGGPVRYQTIVAIGRDVPTISCRAPGGMPAKPGREYALVDVTVD